MSAQPDAETPTATRMASASTVLGMLAPWLIEHDKQPRRQSKAILGCGCFEHDAGGPFENRTYPGADEGTRSLRPNFDPSESKREENETG